MMAANPSRVGGGFAEEHLQALVETVTRVCNNALLQVCYPIRKQTAAADNQNGSSTR
jgi:hypothetical protein